MSLQHHYLVQASSYGPGNSLLGRSLHWIQLDAKEVQLIASKKRDSFLRKRMSLQHHYLVQASSYGPDASLLGRSLHWIPLDASLLGLSLHVLHALHVIHAWCLTIWSETSWIRTETRMRNLQLGPTPS